MPTKSKSSPRKVSPKAAPKSASKTSRKATPKAVTGQELIPLPGSGLDQVGRIGDVVKIIATIQDQVRFQVQEGRPEAALDYLTYLNGVGRISGTGQAAALWTMKDNWKSASKDDPQIDNDGFAEMIFAKVGYATDTVKRYLDAWEFMNEAYGRVKPDTWERLVNRNISDLITLGQATKEHGRFSVAQLDKLSKATDLSSLRQAVRKELGDDEAKSPSGTRWMPDGTLEAWNGDMVQVIGFLVRDTGDDFNDIGAKALAKLVRAARIQDTRL